MPDHSLKAPTELSSRRCLPRLFISLEIRVSGSLCLIAFPLELDLEFLERERIHYILFLQPAFTGNGGAEPEITEMFQSMGITIDHTLHTLRTSSRPESPVHVETVGRGV